jgi:hypothetical protein
MKKNETVCSGAVQHPKLSIEEGGFLPRGFRNPRLKTTSREVCDSGLSGVVLQRRSKKRFNIGWFHGAIFLNLRYIFLLLIEFGYGCQGSYPAEQRQPPGADDDRPVRFRAQEPETGGIRRVGVFADVYAGR